VAEQVEKLRVAQLKGKHTRRRSARDCINSVLDARLIQRPERR
jgi:hypothetical protein